MEENMLKKLIKQVWEAAVVAGMAVIAIYAYQTFISWPHEDEMLAKLDSIVNCSNADLKWIYPQQRR